MDHNFYKEKISAYFDGELKNEIAVMVAEHLKECEICQKELEKLKQFEKVVEKNSQLFESEYWEKSAQRIESAIAAENIETKTTDIKQFAWRGLGWKLTTVAASIALITFIAIYEKNISDKLYDLTEPETIIEKQSTSDKFETDDKLEKDDSISITDEPPTEESGAVETDSDKFQKEPDELKVKTPQAQKDLNESKKELGKDTTPATPQELSVKLQPITAEEYEIQSESLEQKEIDTEKIVLSTTVDKTYTLSDWKEKRDIILASMSKIKIPDLKQGFAKMKTSSRSSVTPKDKDKAFDLLECYYNIALLTKDSVEYNKALEEIEKYSLSDNEEYKKQAKSYMDELSKVEKKQ